MVEGFDSCKTSLILDPIACLSMFSKKIITASETNDFIYVFGSAYASVWARSLISDRCSSRYLHSWDSIGEIHSIADFKKRSGKEQAKIPIVIPFPSIQAKEIASKIGNDISYISL